MTYISRIVLLLVACACAAGTALAQKYPTKPIRVIVPQPPGDPCDTFGRLIGYKVGERLGQQLVVDNRPGASGTIGLALAAKAPADGYTIACGQGGNMSVIPHTMKNVPYDALKDFTPSRWSRPTISRWSCTPAPPTRTSRNL
jgi:tripartite-type tricarboxylate transporter receptor subunit TctC